MNIINILTQKHLNNNYQYLRLRFDELYEKYNENTCSCIKYSPFIHNGPCRFCWRNEKKTQENILKMILKNFY